MTPPARLVLGTTNEGKLRELLELLEPFGIRCRTLTGLPGAVDVEETGDTFAANAALKATQQARALHAWVLAEDSGLVVPGLGGEPGVRSARYSDPAPGMPRPGIDARNTELLLERLAGRSGVERAAHYVCHAVLAEPTGGVVAQATGRCGGLIADRPHGTGGFGYDPIFIVKEYHRTFGELAPAVKAVISHRARAMRAILPAIVAHVSS